MSTEINHEIKSETSNDQYQGKREHYYRSGIVKRIPSDYKPVFKKKLQVQIVSLVNFFIHISYVISVTHTLRKWRRQTPLIHSMRLPRPSYQKVIKKCTD